MLLFHTCFLSHMHHQHLISHMQKQYLISQGSYVSAGTISQCGTNASYLIPYLLYQHLISHKDYLILSYLILSHKDYLILSYLMKKIKKNLYYKLEYHQILDLPLVSIITASLDPPPLPYFYDVLLEQKVSCLMTFTTRFK